MWDEVICIATIFNPSPWYLAPEFHDHSCLSLVVAVFRERDLISIHAIFVRPFLVDGRNRGDDQWCIDILVPPSGSSSHLFCSETVVSEWGAVCAPAATSELGEIVSESVHSCKNGT